MGFFGGGSAASNMVGATSSVAGTAGLVPPPAAGEEDSLLRGDATFGRFAFPHSSYSGFNGYGIYGNLNNVAAGASHVGMNWFRKGTYTKIGFFSGSATSQTLQFGIYKANADGSSGSLIRGATFSSIAAIGFHSATVTSFSLDGGWHYVLMLGSGSTNTRMYVGGFLQFFNPNPASDGTFTYNFIGTAYKSLTYASGLPNPLPNFATDSSWTVTSQNPACFVAA
jgi:hypothetical protein